MSTNNIETQRRWIAQNKDRVNRHRKTYQSKVVREKGEQYEHLLARSATNAMIRRGTLTRQPCEVCGAEPTEAHHDDYSQRHDVRWLCPTHHLEIT